MQGHDMRHIYLRQVAMQEVHKAHCKAVARSMQARKSLCMREQEVHKARKKAVRSMRTVHRRNIYIDHA